MEATNGERRRLVVVPTYEYRCKTCDTRFDVKRPMAEASDPAPCPSGHATTVKLLSSFASVGAGTAGDPGPTAPMQGCGGACACHPG